MLVKVEGRKLDCHWMQLGTQGDNAVELVQFEIPRFTSANVDLSEGIVYILFELSDGTAGLVSALGSNKTVTDDALIINWYVGREVTAQPGRLSIALKISGFNDELWHSEIANCTVAKTIQVESPQPLMYRSRAATVDTPVLYMANPDTEPPITVTERTLNIPGELQNIAVQNDQNSETVKIICPRYYDGHDLSAYSFFLRTQNSNEQYDPVVLSPIVGETELMINWTLKPPQTSYAGTLSIQLWVTGEDFDWQTAPASLNIIAQLAGEPVIPIQPSVMDDFLKQIGEIEGLAKQHAKDSADSATESANSAMASANSAKESADSATAALSSQENAMAAQRAAETAQEAAEKAQDESEKSAQASAEDAQRSEVAASRSEAAKEEAEAIVGGNFVPQTRKVNGHPLDKDVTLNADDVGALDKSVMIRIDSLWAAVFDDLAHNPFSFSFENLDGITLTSGVYNQPLQRIEC